ncbi:protein LHCP TRANSLOCATION DEFECT-like [Olea europaea var. sylvestris]|uniref:protein LHCP TRANSLOCATION DEFECT-like n=1 Tax=Olea europaea var. sylvestris TaxID=158386 RepID=UPI000C1D82ED|nr:protein LHCP TRANSLOCATION DEFECT-like [Olea europaea var. sylvestris]
MPTFKISQLNPGNVIGPIARCNLHNITRARFLRTTINPSLSFALSSVEARSEKEWEEKLALLSEPGFDPGTLATIPSTVQLSCFLSRPTNYSSNGSTACFSKLNSRFLGKSATKTLGCCRHTTRLCPTSGSRTTCWFRFGKNGVDAEGAGVYGSQTRDDFDRDDVEQYFNYMGMLAVEGTYDKMEALLNQNIHPVDILLMMAASEGDKPKIEELLRAGADYTVKDSEGQSALAKAASDEIKDFILGFSVQKA